MTARDPILKQIHNYFDDHGRYPGTGNISLTHMSLLSTPGGYIVHTHNMGARHMLRIDVSARDGVFGEALPHRVLISCDTDSSATFLRGAGTSNGRPFNSVGMGSAHREQLTAPGDPHYELFDGLHAQLGGLLPEVQALAAMLGLEDDPDLLTYKPRLTAAHDYRNHITTYARKHFYQIGAYASGMHLMVADLDATVQTELYEQPPREVSYRKGQVYEGMASWDATSATSAQLVAFAGLNRSLQQLYID